eukprot:7384107-Prymnesium_polylepis.1
MLVSQQTTGRVRGLRAGVGRGCAERGEGSGSGSRGWSEESAAQQPQQSQQPQMETTGSGLREGFGVTWECKARRAGIGRLRVGVTWECRARPSSAVWQPPK